MRALASRLALGALATATTGVALWLFAVTTLVLPARDPSHISMWRAVAVGLLAYSGLSAACLAGGLASAGLRWSLRIASAAALVLGTYGVLAMIRHAAGGGHFEGYVVLMGLILGAHGLAAIAYTCFANAPADRR